MAKHFANIKKLFNSDPRGVPLGRNSQSTDKWTENAEATNSEIPSRKRQEVMEERFSELKKMLDEDPFGVIFGRRLQWTKSPENVPLSNSTNIRASKSKGTSSVKNPRDLNGSVISSNGHCQEAVPRSHSEPSSQDTRTQSVAGIESQNDELEFDPITMRKVPKKRSHVAVTPRELGTDGSFSIPVKPFTSPISNNMKISATSSDTSVHTNPQAMPSIPKCPTAASTSSELERGWLAREGFAAQGHKAGDSVPSFSNKESRKNRNASFSRIESALDRHIKSKQVLSDQNLADSSYLKYPANENSEEDVDLLRPSDVRASVGLSKRVSKPTTAEKQERRSILTDDYEGRNHKLDRRLEVELASQRAAATNTSTEAKVVESLPKCNKDHSIAVSGIESSTPSMATGQPMSSESGSSISKTALSSQAEARRRGVSQRANETEVEAQKVAMEAIEMRDKIGSSQREFQPLQPHRAGESGIATKIDEFAGRTSPQERDQQSTKDKAFISQIRSIYENRYGIIDANHRQPSIEAAEIGTVEPQPGTTISPENAADEILEKTTKSANAEGQAEGEHQKPLGEGDNIPITSEQLKSSGDPGHPAQQDHKLGDQSETHRQLLREVFKTQNLIRDLCKRVSESQLPKSVATESLDGPSVPEQSLRQPSNSSSMPVKSQGDLCGAEKTVNDKEAKAKLHASAEPAWIHSDPTPPSNLESEAEEIAAIPVSYRILAYDPSTQRVTAAKNTFLTSPASERRLTVAEALSGLANPAKFLPHFASLQNAGYEIVSGSSNLLIFKKTDSEKESSMSTDEHALEFKGRYSMPTNPIDGTTPQTGNFASPTGFVNYDSILPTPDLEEQTPWQKDPRAPRPSDKVRREEPVFSGSSRVWRNSHEEKVGKWASFKSRQRRKRRWRTARRMLWAGAWVAGCCYAGGVANEALRPLIH